MSNVKKNVNFCQINEAKHIKLKGVGCMKKELFYNALALFPRGLAMEIETVVKGRVSAEDGLGEIRLIAEGRSSLVHNRDVLGLTYCISKEETENILLSMCSGGIYAYRDTIKQGYISLFGGVRVGISGTARYDNGRIVGISDPRTLVFRFPIGRCDFGKKIIRIYEKGIGNGMLIYSPPGLGKTTALRTLAAEISRNKRLCVIDERGEFDSSDLPSASVLSGYEKALGIEIALRTHSPEVIMIDEIGMREGEALLSVLGAGVPVIATAHAGDVDGLIAKSSIAPLVEKQLFSVFVGIFMTQKGYKLIKTNLSEVADRIKSKECVL